MSCLTSVLYQACIHPEQYSNTLPKDALKTLHEKIHSVTTTAANVLGDSSKFPADWLFSYRWGKSNYRGKKGGKAESNVLPNGEKIVHITVGGRTSAVVESRQKKIKSSDEPAEVEDKKPTPKKGKKVKDEELEDGEDEVQKGTKKKGAEDTPGKRKAKAEIKEEETTPKKRRVSGKLETNGKAKEVPLRKSSRSKAS
jgi:formamidopyrimidine-DNA glycosylase